MAGGGKQISASPVFRGRDLLSTSAQHTYLSSSPLAEQFLADDIAACSDDDADHGGLPDAPDALVDGNHPARGHGMYRRPSGVAYGGTRPVFNAQRVDEPILTPMERKQSRDAERSLLRDNHVLPPKHLPGREEEKHNLAARLYRRLYRRLFSTKLAREGIHDEHHVAFPGHVVPATERSPLLNGQPEGSDSASGSGDDLDQQWEEAVASGRVHTTWQREAKTVVAYSLPLITDRKSVV